jgi:hypothetical protein
MFLSPTGDTLFYRRRLNGQDTLFAFQPDSARAEHHAQLAASKTQLRAWATHSGQVVVCENWPRAPGGLRLRFYDARRISDLLEKQAKKLNELLTDVPALDGFTSEKAALPVEIFERVKGEVVAVPGLASPLREPTDDRQSPALYVVDGVNVTYYTVPLPFVGADALPGGLYTEPSGKRHWLTVGDSNHLFVLDARTHELVGDLIWPAEEKALARVAFHPTRNEAWVSAHSSIFIYNRDDLRLLDEISIEDELRWHRGERVLGFIGAVTFSHDGSKALVARPMSGDLLELDVSTRSKASRIPVAVDPLELLFTPSAGRAYMQSLRNGNISWLPYR